MELGVKRKDMREPLLNQIRVDESVNGNEDHENQDQLSLEPDDDDDALFEQLYGEPQDEFQFHVFRKLTWDDSSHWKVLTQMYGSVWPRVFPYCMVNCFWTLLIWYLKHYRSIDLSVAPHGHQYAAMLMSFLLVTQLKVLYDDYMSNAKDLTLLCKSIRDLIANTCVLTSRDRSPRAKQWRQDVAYSALLFLRTCIAVVQFRSNPEEHPWRLPEFMKEYESERNLFSFDKVTKPSMQHSQRNMKHKAKVEGGGRRETQSSRFYHETLQEPSFVAQSQRRRGALPSVREEPDTTSQRTTGHLSNRSDHIELLEDPLLLSPNDEEADIDDDDEMYSHFGRRHSFLKKTLAHVHHDERNEMEEASRAPYVMALTLRSEIMKQRDGKWFRERSKVFEHPCNEEVRLLDFVGDGLKAFSSLVKTITTGLPFPLIQMARTFLFVWVFTVPLVLTHERFNRSKIDHPLIPIILVFTMTYGFLGLEFVCLEITDTFGNYPSDFDGLGYCHLTMEDCYLHIYQTDGKAWANALRKRFRPNRELR